MQGTAPQLREPREMKEATSMVGEGGNIKGFKPSDHKVHEQPMLNHSLHIHAQERLHHACSWTFTKNLHMHSISVLYCYSTHWCMFFFMQQWCSHKYYTMVLL
jgi:hypothetical protein